MSAKSDPLARIALAALLAFFLPAAGRAQDVECDQPNEREVRSLRFEGNYYLRRRAALGDRHHDAIVVRPAVLPGLRDEALLSERRAGAGRRESQSVLRDKRVLRHAHRYRRDAGVRLAGARDVSHQRGAAARPGLSHHHRPRFCGRSRGDSAGSSARRGPAIRPAPARQRDGLDHDSASPRRLPRGDGVSVLRRT